MPYHAAGAEAKLRERVSPRSSVVRLGDVADVTARDVQRAQEFAAVPLMPAPAPGTQRYLRRREVADMLEASGIGLGDIHLVGAEQVAIVTPANSPNGTTRISEEVTARRANHRAAMLAGERPEAARCLAPQQVEELRSLVQRTINSYVQAKSPVADAARIECNPTLRQLTQLADATSMPVCSGGSEPWTGRQRFTLAFTTATGAEQLVVAADVPLRPVPVVVAVRAVSLGNPITAADVEVQMIEPNARMAGQRNTFDRVDTVIGQEARKTLQAGGIVYADQVRSPLLVKRGDLVAVGAQSGRIRVRTSARAIQDGAHGDLIQVETLESKDRFVARVVGLREAAVMSISSVRESEPERSASNDLLANGRELPSPSQQTAAK